MDTASEQWIDERGGDLYIKVYIQPGSSKNEITGFYRDSLKIRLTSSPVDGAANLMLIRFLVKMLRLSKSSAKIVSGKKSRQKTLKIEGVYKKYFRRIVAS